jgi:hypothetical protein
MISLIVCILMSIVAMFYDVDYRDTRLILAQIFLVALAMVEVITLDFYIYNCKMGFVC